MRTGDDCKMENAKDDMKSEEQREAQRIVDDFVDALEKSLGSEGKKAGKDAKEPESAITAKQGNSMRAPEEQENDEARTEFISIFFSNAPKVKGQFILTEKKKW